ncbi:hypothetical protein GCM10010191_13390 [Actinomadura vinacea]|uniref:Basic secretory peptidase family protein n=1 Tax=Actinomadura vinacea TaxID=115336 RepID=A0ABN3ILJ1_9ACTN
MDRERGPGVPRRKALTAIAAGSAVCALAGAGLSAAGSEGPARSASGDQARTLPGPDVGPPDREAVATVLANRAAAVRDRDRAAFMATVAAAPAGYRQAQAAMFDNLLKLPLDGWRERFERVVSTTGSAVLVQVTLGYRLRGHDADPLRRNRHLAFAPRSGTWVITGAGAERGLPDDAEIWDGGPLTAVRGRTGLVIGDGPALAEIARRLDEAVPAVARITGAAAVRGWRGRVVALVPGTDARAGALAGGDRDLGGIAALATVAPTAGGPGADRVVIAPGTFGRLNDLGRDVVLTHELTHVATGGARDGRTPIWLIEGFADYVGYHGMPVSVPSAARELRREVAAGRLPAGLPGRTAFDAAASGRLSQSYQEAWLACRMIADRYGEASLVRLYRAAGRRSEAAALREVLGLTPARFTAEWRDYLRRELR